MSLFFRPVVSVPVRCAPAFYARPAPPFPDFTPFFAAFDEGFTHLEAVHRQAQQTRRHRRPFNPRFNVKESSGEYSLEGELPGFDAKDVSIEFLDDGHTLQIQGKTVNETRQSQPKALSQAQTSQTSIQDTNEQSQQSQTQQGQAETASETSSLKSTHQATVEDDPEERTANSSAVQDQQTTQTTPAQAEIEKVESKPEVKDLVTERYVGSFSRSFKFPSKIDQEAVRASLKDGILAITLPFARKPESRRIQIE